MREGRRGGKDGRVERVEDEGGLEMREGRREGKDGRVERMEDERGWKKG